MCTSVSYKANHHFFGRNLDLHYTLDQEIIIVPREYPFHFRNGHINSNHYALIGMGIVETNTPLYFDATNEKGLSAAGLNYPKNAHYFSTPLTENVITSFEVIPFILSQCETILEVKNLLKDITICDESFNENFPNSPLHWLIADSKNSITVESDKDGLHIYDNPVGVLTNNPPFPKQLFNLNNYRHLTTKTPENTFSSSLDLDTYSNGMGGIGLPGDLSSMSRFVRASFVKENILETSSLEEDIYQFFNILDAVKQQKGLCDVGNQQYEYTIYSSCCDTDSGVYYYKTYNNSQINAVALHNENLDFNELKLYPLKTDASICYINKKDKE